VGGLLLPALLFGLMAAPFAINWFASTAEPPDPSEHFRYSANLAGFFIPFQATTPLYGGLFGAWGREWQLYPGVAGYEIFVGFPLLLFGLLAAVVVRERLLRVVLAVAVIFFGLSLGPALKLLTWETGLELPYALLAEVPPFNVGRSPVRFVVIGMFFWMILAAWGLHWVQQRLTVRYGSKIALAVMALVFIWTVAEVYSPLLQKHSSFAPPPQMEQIHGPTLELPLKFRDGWSLLRQIFHQQPLATGELSRNTAEQRAHFETLRIYYAEAVRTGSCEQFVALGFRNVIIRADVPPEVAQGLMNSPNCTLKIIDAREGTR
jgi:hypothetical protein